MHLSPREQLDQISAQLEQTRDAFKREKKSIHAANPSWHKIRDTRVALLNKLINTMNSALLGLLFLRDCLLNEAWWNDAGKGHVCPR